MTTSAAVRTVPEYLQIGLGAVVFLANAALLVLQLLAGRYLAPFIGSSVETWTCVIGVFLTGIALGNHYGGRIADRLPSTRTLAKLLVLGAVSSLSMILWWVVFRTTGLDRVLPLGPRIPILAALFCFPPAFVLSLITPLTIKLMLPDVTKAGRVAGLVFALGTLGCLLGNYLTGFWLMAELRLNTISMIVAVGLLALAVPMYLAEFRLDTVMPAAAPQAAGGVNRAEDPLGFRQDIRRAFAVVFVASFCGMSLELTGVRVLAPVLGVSLYTWTGIIGVMLAGTACGNYLGGIIADRGGRVGLQRFALLIATAGGFAAGPAFIRTFRLDGRPDEGSTWAWVARLVAAGAAFGLALLAVRKSDTRRGWLVNLFAVGAVIGFAVAHPVARSFGRLLGLRDPAAGFADVGASIGLDVGSLVVHLLGAATGGLIALGLGYDPPSAKKPAGDGTSALSVCLFCAALFTGLVVLINGMFQNEQLQIGAQLTGTDIVWNVLTWTFLLFFIPMLCLGTISPQVIRLAIPDTARAGRVAGTVYAWSTAGAIAGTFVTGYFLIDWLGMSRVLFVLSLVLMVLTFILGRLWKNTPLLFVGSIVFGIGVVGMFLSGWGSGGYTMESKYYAIKVTEDRDERYGPGVKLLTLDHLIHSYANPDDPTMLGYPHEQVQGELVRYARGKGSTEVLVIGGGGYTFPRWVEYVLPDVGVDVVEIDPAVTEVAHRELGLSRNTKIRSHHLDGRQFIRERARKGHYQYVIQDAVNDLSVPYHLMTKEYNDAVKETLAPGGAYLLTLIDSVENGELWRAAVHTMRQSFQYVELLDPEGFERPDARTVFIVYGSDEPFDLAEVRAVAQEAYMRKGQPREAYTHELERDRLEKFLGGRPAIVLTDQYAPVDNLMARVFAEQARGH
ncbi:MAG TPA: fused MFS/spermidine synthase [Gemmataceae bacterium]|nr:fused MFS/spermidine synthase [Gemmataceae bacterium]